VLRATKARNLRLETMIRIRATVDEIEATVPAKDWTLATYKDLVSFLSSLFSLSSLSSPSSLSSLVEPHSYLSQN